MQTDLNHIIKDPAPGGIFCFKKTALTSLLLLSLQLSAQPRLEAADAKKSFGFVKKGEVVKLDYDITNKGDQPLLITDAEISCSCTRVDFTKEPVLPGKSVKVTVIFDTKSAYDRQDRIVYLISNDPSGKKKIRYKGFVRRQ